MLKRLIPVYLLLCLLLTACGVPDSLKGFDSETWKNDRYACNGQRQKLTGEFEKIRRELYGKKEYVVRNLLGKPDSESLLERNQRIYYYYLEPGSQCDDRSKLSEANWVEVRINPTGKVSEVTFKNPL
ncbi:hypothetical protein K0O23_09810 [Pontibacter aydingkolensis]|uniref:Lipoprotein n=1 Tax=Pontibacter aydingkolensis TaxID=1911536 RepID=A0ABS7CU37_9BACT|nr:hypothetical protein [Pontibacter aydingkolensis]MBW7467365.1 hypothetical protein [Pontibacter aydingkolensis]